MPSSNIRHFLTRSSSVCAWFASFSAILVDFSRQLLARSRRLGAEKKNNFKRAMQKRPAELVEIFFGKVLFLVRNTLSVDFRLNLAEFLTEKI